MPAMKFNASLDVKAKIVTLSTTTLFGVIIYLFISHGDHERHFWNSIGGDLIGTVILTGVYAFTYALSPRAYILEKEKITIKRPGRDVVIQMSDIRDISAVNKDAMNANVERAFASDGLFGYFGEFTSGGFGLMTWYATRKANYVLLETNYRHKIILTPDDTGFIDEVRKCMDARASK
jgi:hypothetical protein